MNPEENKITALVPMDAQGLSSQKPELSRKESYWGRMAMRYTQIFRVMLVALLIFVVLFVLLFSRVFTYDSMFSFFKDMQTVSGFVSSDYGTVNATYEQGDATALSYRGGVAFVNRSGIEIYSPNGGRLTDISRAFENPRATASRKYLVAFDQGGNSFSVTNSYAELFRGETEFAILGAAVSDSGHFALITEADRTDPEKSYILSHVLLYDNNFNLIRQYNRVTATVGVDISDNGKYIAFFGATAHQGAVRACLDICRIGEKTEEARATVCLDNEMPLAMGFTNNKNLVILTDRNLRACELDGDTKTTVELNGVPVGFSVDANGALLAIETDSVVPTNRLVALSRKGKITYDKGFEGDVNALAMGNDEIFLLSGSKVIRIDCDDEASESVTVLAGATDIFVVDDHQIRIVYPAMAQYVNFENVD